VPTTGALVGRAHASRRTVFWRTTLSVDRLLTHDGDIMRVAALHAVQPRCSRTTTQAATDDPANLFLELTRLRVLCNHVAVARGSGGDVRDDTVFFDVRRHQAPRLSVSPTISRSRRRR
jgi:hypothetical protein